MLLIRDRMDDCATNQNKRTQGRSQIESGQEGGGNFIDIAAAAGVNRGAEVETAKCRSLKTKNKRMQRWERCTAEGKELIQRADKTYRGEDKWTKTPEKLQEMEPRTAQLAFLGVWEKERMYKFQLGGTIENVGFIPLCFMSQVKVELRMRGLLSRDLSIYLIKAFLRRVQS